MTTINFTSAAQANMSETGVTQAEVERDLSRVRRGEAEQVLAYCLDGADSDRVQGWREYVAALEAAAAVTTTEPVTVGGWYRLTDGNWQEFSWRNGQLCAGAVRATPPTREEEDAADRRAWAEQEALDDAQA